MSKKKGLGKFVLGALVGSTLGILFAPKKGSDTRRELQEKFDDIIKQVKQLDAEEVKCMILTKVDEIKDTIRDLDKEQVKEIALEKVGYLKVKCEELVELVKEKGTPVLEKTAQEARKAAITVTKQILNKLETEEGK